MNVVDISRKVWEKLDRQAAYVRQDERGATMVYLALVLAVLLGFAGLAIDGSNAYFQRRRMQTAADAAALAGARALAYDMTNAEVSAEIQTVATLNGADSVQWQLTDGGRSVDVQVTHDFNTFFASVVGSNGASIVPAHGTGSDTFDLFSVGANSSAGFEPVVGHNKLLPITVDCQCAQYGEIVTTPPEYDYCIENAYQPYEQVYYGVWLREVDPTYVPGPGNWNPAEWHYAMDIGSGTYDEDSSGNVHITGTVHNPDGEGFHVDYMATGRTSAVPPNSPKWPSYGVDTSNWYYYTSLTGTLTGIAGGRYDGARLSVTSFGPAFQIGTGANMYDQVELGAASWYDVHIDRQPSTGVVLSSSRGDINIRLATCPRTATTTNTCQFKWLDWNGGNLSQHELEANLSDPTSSGEWLINDWIPTGPNSAGGITLNVKQTLDNVLGQPVTIPLHDGSIDDDAQNLVCGFAEIVLKSHNLNNGLNEITVEFSPSVVRGTVTNPNAADYGARDIQIHNSAHGN